MVKAAKLIFHYKCIMIWTKSDPVETKKWINYVKQSYSPSETRSFINWSCPSLSHPVTSHFGKAKWESWAGLQCSGSAPRAADVVGWLNPDPPLTVRSDPSGETYTYASQRSTPISEFLITLCVRRPLTALGIMFFIDYVVRWSHPGGLREEFIQTLKWKQTGLQPCTVMDPWENSGFESQLGHSN